jgi:L,D-peptidoglycan transpeptidase YkuD (ErfK/YbiS/YcfS/YnhG family)
MKPVKACCICDVVREAETTAAPGWWRLLRGCRVKRSLRMLVIFAGLGLSLGCQHLLPAPRYEGCLDAVAGGKEQAVVVSREKGAGVHRVKVDLFEKGTSGWGPVNGRIDGVAGPHGLAPRGEKREGDGRTPSGVFSIKRGFGYFPLETKLPYIVLTPDLIWVDDPRSPEYNRLVSLDRVHPASYETMRRKDDLYKYGVVIEYNTDPVVSGLGSAIFLHIWRDSDSPTAGCVAVSEENMLRILRWLDPAKAPVAVLGAEEVCGRQR